MLFRHPAPRRASFIGLVLLMLLVVGLVAAGEIPFAPAQPIGGGTEGSTALTLADVNRDGRPEVLGATRDGGQLVWWEHKADAGTSWTAHLVTAAFAGVTTLQTADFNRDGRLEVVAAGAAGVAWWACADTQGTSWTMHAVTSAPVGAGALATGDFDRDGAPDLALADPAAGQITWLKGAARGTSWSASVIAGDFAGASALAVADVNHDGCPEVIGATCSTGQVAWWAAPTSGSQQWTRTTVDPQLAGVSALAAGDVDRDGDVDLVGSGGAGGPLVWWENTARDGSAWLRHEIDPQGGNGAQLAFIDLDHDGDLDLLGCAQGAAGGPALVWWENADGKGQSWQRHEVAGGAGAVAAVALDLDRDGDLDLVFSAPDRPGPAWCENRSIHAEVVIEPAQVMVAGPAPVTGPVYYNPYLATSCDLDNDGNLDLLGTTRSNYQIVYWTNTAGDGSTWREHVIDIIFNSINAVAAADLDGDGDLDLIVGSDSSTATPEQGGLCWLENINGDGQTWGRHVLDSSYGVGPVTAADLNFDGRMDIVDASGRETAWWEQPAAAGGQWVRHIIVNGSIMGAFKVADIDRDGDLDLYIFSDYPDWMENTTGDGLNWQGHSIGSSHNNSYINLPELADLDGDGDLDAFVSNGWYENPTGQGLIWRQHSEKFSYLLAADLDSNGWPEVIGRDLNDYMYYWLRRDAAGVWNRNKLGDSTKIPLQLADLTHDGSPDVLFSGSFKSVSWWQTKTRQYRWRAENVAPAHYDGGQTLALTRVILGHAGDPGDDALRLGELALRFEAQPGAPLSSAQAAQVIDRLQIYRDNATVGAPGQWDGADSLMLTTTSLALDGAGVAHLALRGMPGAELAVGESADYFMVAHLCQTDPPTTASLRVTCLAGESRVEDAVYGTPLRTVDTTDPVTMLQPRPTGWQWDVLLDPVEQRQLTGNTMTWTGDKVFIWGGRLGGWLGDGELTNQGWIFDHRTRLFTPMSTAGAPTARYDHTAVWTGDRLLIWGGRISTTLAKCSAGGASYDPVTDHWDPLPNAPLNPRSQHAAVWTGREMLVWGGWDSGYYTNSGAAYNPATKTWRTLATSPLEGRVMFSAVWTGQRMIVWGGSSYLHYPVPTYYNDGASYDPVTDRWQKICQDARIAGRDCHSAVWMGARMLILGGAWPKSTMADNDWAYDPVADQWSPYAFGGYGPHRRASAVDIGPEVLYWGGSAGGKMTTDGLHIDPLSTRTQPMVTAGAPGPRLGQQAVWLGREPGMLVMGGMETDYNAPRNYALYSYRAEPEPPVADFSARPPQRNGAQPVLFLDTTMPSAESWQWDFDNDGTVDSTEQNPTHIYDKPGTYTVRLRVGNAYGTDEIVKTDLIRITYDPPRPDFTGTPYSGQIPLRVYFKDATQGEVNHWAWDFDNDGKVDSTAQNPTAFYDKPGTYTVRLRAGNDAGEAELVKTNLVVSWSIPKPMAEITPTSGPAPLTVHFRDTSLNEPTTWAWHFNGDNQTDSTEQNPVFTYTQPGIYKVSLRAGNGHVSTLSSKWTVTVTSATPTVKRARLVRPFGPAAPWRRLDWDATDYPWVRQFAVYDSAAPITDENKAGAHRQQVNVPSLGLDRPARATVHYYRVAALDQQDREGPLGNEIKLDTTFRLAWLENTNDSYFLNLKVAPVCGGAAVLQVSPEKGSEYYGASMFRFSPADASLIFTLEDMAHHGNFCLYQVMNPGEDSPRRVMPATLAHGAYPRFSPDGQQLAWQGRVKLSTAVPSDLYCGPVDGAQPTMLNPTLDWPNDKILLNFQFSPDSQRICFTRYLSSNSPQYENYLRPLNGTNRLLIPGERRMVLFTPDGRSLAYVDDTGGREEIHQEPVTGVGKPIVANTVDPYVYSAINPHWLAFSPDGKWVAYASDKGAYRGCESVYVSPATTNTTSLVRLSESLPQDVWDGYTKVRFSPDGQYLAWIAYMGATKGNRLYAAPVNGTTPAVLIGPASDNHQWHDDFAFLPDSRRLVYNVTSKDGPGLFVGSVTGDGETVKLDRPDNTPSWVERLSLSPEGRHVAYWAEAGKTSTGDTNFGLFVVPVSGGREPICLGTCTIDLLESDSGIELTDPWMPFAFSPLGIEPDNWEGRLTIQPDRADAGWVLTGPEGLRIEDRGTTTILQAPAGRYAIEWQPVAGHATPTSAKLTLHPDETTSFTAHYVRQLGRVAVEVEPPTAAWELTDGDGQAHAGTGAGQLEGIPTGELALAWQPLANFDAPTPNPARQTLAADAATTFTGRYTRQTGTVAVKVTPPAAPWTLTDGDGQPHAGAGSQTLTALPTGRLTLAWGALDGYDRPSGLVQDLGPGGTTTFSAEYRRQTGSVRVEVWPTTATWTLTDGDGGAHAGAGKAELAAIPTGRLALAWTVPAGYDPPTTNPVTRQLTPNGQVSFSEILVPTTSNPERSRARLLRYLTGLDVDPAGLDFNRDSRVDVADLLYLAPHDPTLPAKPAPADGAVGVAVTTALDWADGERAKTWRLYLWKDGETTPTAPTAAGLAVSAYKPAAPLAFAMRYAWRVAALNGDWVTTGPVWHFLTAPNPVQVLAPKGGETWKTGAQVTVHWKLLKAVAGSAARLELWRAGARAAVLAEQSYAESGDKEETVTVPAVAPGSDYRVRAVSLWLEGHGDGAPPWDESDATFTVIAP